MITRGDLERAGFALEREHRCDLEPMIFYAASLGFSSPLPDGVSEALEKARGELREKFNELIFDYGDNDGQYFLHNRTSGFNVLLEYARKWQKAKEAEEGGMEAKGRKGKWK